ncbi:hypothetical protein RM543_00320 [Roseicyclus sp. F158]|uniref:Uncharacterized protein n=1 Tax=Tropicimonas omnivorans TaxID=3075590 RepID=A0ABU3DBM2_9RHOB|nr:hypothetical protein [Roseicyclus sp. F158]MDT0681112.1 hypothetical protein [Roseicyclus sp. F158]
MNKAFSAVVLLGLMTASATATAQELSAGRSWSGSWGFGNSSEKNYRLTVADTQKKLEEGYYDAIGRNTLNTYYDHSVGAMSVEAAEGSSVTVEQRTADGTGNTTSTTTIGAQTNTTTDISIDGSGNTIGIGSSADSNGCQDGSIQMSTSVVDGIDISSGTSSSASNSGGMTC